MNANKLLADRLLRWIRNINDQTPREKIQREEGVGVTQDEGTMSAKQRTQNQYDKICCCFTWQKQLLCRILERLDEI